jgi:NTP pyrophosphatase (non-canonical NTP hydrolase)
MTEIQDIINKIVAFRDERDWAQFHNSKDLALAISIEAAELNELFLWKSAEDVAVDKVKEELADVLMFSLLLAHQHGLDIVSIIQDKLAVNEAKYPVDKSKGSAKKYTEL